MNFSIFSTSSDGYDKISRRLLGPDSGVSDAESRGKYDGVVADAPSRRVAQKRASKLVESWFFRRSWSGPLFGRFGSSGKRPRRWFSMSYNRGGQFPSWPCKLKTISDHFSCISKLAPNDCRFELVLKCAALMGI